MGGNLLLYSLIARRNTLKSSDPLQGFTSTPGLVGEHASNGTFENLVRSTMMERAPGWVDVTPLTKETQELQLVPIKNK